MNPQVANRLLAIQQSLMAHHSGGREMPNATKGNERELLVRSYFSKVFPPVYRFGTGAIVDGEGATTGQVDVVLELPLAPSFPMPSGDDRLYLAESVAAVIEAKSDLSSQWDDVLTTVARVKALRRDLYQPERRVLESSPDPEFRNPDPTSIACYAVGYTGHRTIAGLRGCIENSPVDSRPDGALVIESGCFVGQMGEAEGAAGLFAFVAELAAQLNDLLGIAYPRIARYGRDAGSVE